MLLKYQRIFLIAALMRFRYEITHEIQGRLAQEDWIAHNKGTCDQPIGSKEELSQSES